MFSHTGRAAELLRVPSLALAEALLAGALGHVAVLGAVHGGADGLALRVALLVRLVADRAVRAVHVLVVVAPLLVLNWERTMFKVTSF